MTKEKIIQEQNLITRKFSIAMRNRNMSIDEFYNRIRENADITFEALLKERLGFYKCGQLLNKAKLQLKQSFKQLQKRLINDKVLSLRQQQRFMKVSSSPRISKYIMRLPPFWTFAEWLDSLPEQQFKKIENKINRKVEKRELIQILDLPKKLRQPNNKFSNLRNEIVSILINETKIKKEDNEDLKKFISSLKSLVKKYSFLEVNEKEYLKQTYEYLSNKSLPKEEREHKFKKSFNSKKIINI
jgi:hypothetical protein